MQFNYLNHGEKLEISTELSGEDLLKNAFLNKDLAFTEYEREQFNLFGLLPAEYENLDTQIKRCYLDLQQRTSNLSKYIFLRNIQDTNEVLFYALLQQYQHELLPIIYAPTLGIVSEKFSEIGNFRKGIFISYPQIKNIEKIFSNPVYDHIKLIIVTDGEGVLSLGDQGIGGMSIAIGKSTLYTLCAGISPANVLAIFLDVGTDNLERINHPLYAGWRHERIRGEAYYHFINEFVQAIKKRFPWVLLHWEDFEDTTAYSILNQYRNQLCTINGDIQGTPIIALSTILSAIQYKHEKINEQVFVIIGASSISAEIGEWITSALMQTQLTEAEALQSIFIVDPDQGLLLSNQQISAKQKKFAKDPNSLANWQCDVHHSIRLVEVIRNAKATVLIGKCGRANIFDREVAVAIHANTPQPIILALSNPQDHCEANPSDILSWTNFQAIISTGSPYAAVENNKKTYPITQTNNIYIFPGMGLGLISAQVKFVPDELYLCAAESLVAQSKKYYQTERILLPHLQHIREISYHIALVVAEKAIELGISEFQDFTAVKKRLQNRIWHPRYLPLKKS